MTRTAVRSAPAAPAGWFDRFCGSAQPERLAVVRVAVYTYAAGYLVVRAGAVRAVTRLRPSRFEPIGPLWWLDAPVAGWLVDLLLLVTIVACVAAAAGLRYRLSAPVAAAGVLALLTYRLSWGQVLHTENLLVAHAVLLAIMPAADAWSLDDRARERIRPERSWAYGWALQTLALATALGYVIAAWAKIRNGGLDWITGDVLRSHIAYDNLRKQVLGDPSSPFVELVVPHRWLFPPLAAASMVIELGAVAALAHGAVRHAWLLATWLFHVAILALMAILFPYQLLGIAFLPFLPGDDIVRSFGRAWRRRGTA